jgi:hypothetical protein
VLAVMICRCQPPVECGRRVSQSTNNPNREYFTCVNPAGNCKFFQWVDTPVGGAMRTQRPAAAVATVVSNKPQIVLSVAEMILDAEGDSTSDEASSSSSSQVWINVMV